MDVTLATRRLILRQPRPTDAPRLARLLDNFAISGKLSRVPHPYSEADAIWWLGTWRADRPPAETGFTMELPGEGLIGHCGFHLTEGEPTIGYWLGEPYWNRGFMTEAAAAALDWYFEVTSAMQESRSSTCGMWLDCSKIVQRTSSMLSANGWTTLGVASS